MSIAENTRTMRLGDFILENMEIILAEWEDYARRYWSGPLPGSATLRDHAQLMLIALVRDMSTFQSVEDRQSKSEGEQMGRETAMNYAALRHAMSRVADGFDIGRMVAEFRALRASINHLWLESVPAPHQQQIEDMRRFNEALDQLVAGSVEGFTERVERSRRLFLGILGHDLRQPLYSITMFNEILLDQGGLPADAMILLSKMGKCCDSMTQMLGDLLEFTTSQLGKSMPVYPVPTNLEAICQEVLQEVQSLAPGRRFVIKTSGDLRGEWDPSRLRQIVSNLLSNAIQHGSADHPIHVILRGSGDAVSLAVHNQGRPIPEKSMGILFDPMIRLADKMNRPPGSIGLGLYICREIAVAHGGSIGVESSAEGGTTLTVIMPKRFVQSKEPAGNRQ